MALKMNKHFVQDLLKASDMQIIVIAGTNGKTTTARMLKTILEKNAKKVFLNESGANLLNGIASSLILHSKNGTLPYDFAIFEVDENALPKLLEEVTPHYIILLNLFRDQLDRYGEVRTIAMKWKSVVESLPSRVNLILNADDPQVGFLGEGVKAKVFYFGLEDINLHQLKRDHAVDSIYCPRCQAPLTFTVHYYAHLGNWHCERCSAKISGPIFSKFPLFPLSGIYNRYNTLAAALTTSLIGIPEADSAKSLENFTPAFGRQEKLTYEGKNIQLFLSKNPTSFNQSLRTIMDLGGKHILIVLNDRVADGHDVSWIWDTDIEYAVSQFQTLTVSGDRTYDMALRVKYTQDFPSNNPHLIIEPVLSTAIKKAVSHVLEDETLFILPTYTAMLETRKILTGKKIL
jgi:UDP-N-acetylmuramyl tripeptide synthase